MRFVFLLFFAVVGLVAKPLVFSALPLKNEQATFQAFGPMVAYLEKTLHVKIHYRYFPTYENLLEAIGREEVDLAYLGPLPYVLLQQENPSLTPLVVFNESDGHPFYTCALIAYGPQPKNVSFQKKATFALTDPRSTCGYLAVSGLLAERGVALEEQYYRYLGRHDTVALAVVRGEFAYGGVKKSIADEYGHLGIETLLQTPLLPGFSLVANAKTVPEALRQKIQKALLEASIMETMGWAPAIRRGTVAANDGMYEEVRTLLKAGAIPEKGNF